MASGRRPVVALTAAVERTHWGEGWEGEAVLLPADYARAVERAGGLALLVPPDPALATAPDDLLDAVDALLLSGGADLDPASFGAEPLPGLETTDPRRDAIEIALARRAIARDLPVLGICRGLQVLNVATGGTLHQHLPDALGHSEHRRRIASFEGNRHDVVLAEGSRLRAIERTAVLHPASHHHQGVDRIGRGLRVTAWSPEDELVEGVEVASCRFAVGVQWHPEIEEEGALIGALVEAARAADRVPAAR